MTPSYFPCRAAGKPRSVSSLKWSPWRLTVHKYTPTPLRIQLVFYFEAALQTIVMHSCTTNQQCYLFKLCMYALVNALECKFSCQDSSPRSDRMKDRSHVVYFGFYNEPLHPQQADSWSIPSFVSVLSVCCLRIDFSLKICSCFEKEERKERKRERTRKLYFTRIVV